MTKYATTQATGLQDITPGKLYGVHASGPIGFSFHDDKGGLRCLGWGQHGFSVHHQPDAKGKTLKELDVKPGDVVEHIVFPDGDSGDYDWHFMIQKNGDAVSIVDSNSWFGVNDKSTFRIISRASDTTEALEELAELDSEEIAGPKAFGEMSDVEQGALLLAEHKGGVIEVYCLGFGNTFAWEVKEVSGVWHDNMPYRRRPEPVVREVKEVWKTIEKMDALCLVLTATYHDDTLVKLVWEKESNT